MAYLEKNFVHVGFEPPDPEGPHASAYRHLAAYARCEYSKVNVELRLTVCCLQLAERQVAFWNYGDFIKFRGIFVCIYVCECV